MNPSTSQLVLALLALGVFAAAGWVWRHVASLPDAIDGLAIEQHDLEI